MKKVYVVSYDFHQPDPTRYEGLFSALKGFAGWWHFLSGTWLVATELPASQIFERLRPHIDEKVNILILEAGRDFSGWLPKEAWEWIKANQSQSPVPSRNSA